MLAFDEPVTFEAQTLTEVEGEAILTATHEQTPNGFNGARLGFKGGASLWIGLDKEGELEITYYPHVGPVPK